MRRKRKSGAELEKLKAEAVKARKINVKRPTTPTVFFLYLFEIEKNMFVVLAQINRMILPSFTKKRLDISRAKKWQLAIIAWRYYVTIRALER